MACLAVGGAALAPFSLPLLPLPLTEKVVAISRRWYEFQRFFHVDGGAGTAARGNSGAGPEQ